MPYRDLREYIKELDRRGLLQTIDATMDKDTELVTLVRLQFRGLPEPQRKAFWFRNVTDPRGTNFEGSSVVLGALGSSRAVYAAACGVDEDAIASLWAQAQGNHKPPKVVAVDDEGRASGVTGCRRTGRWSTRCETTTRAGRARRRGTRMMRCGCEMRR